MSPAPWRHAIGAAAAVVRAPGAVWASVSLPAPSAAFGLAAALGLAAFGLAAALAGCHHACTDADGDGYCVDPDPDCSGTDPYGLPICITPPADCDDADPSVHPYAVEVPEDGIDQNCDGQDAVETCDGVSDGNLNGLRGCADPACTAICAATRTARCTQAPASPVTSTPLSLPGVVAPGLDTMQPSCFAGGGVEQVFRLVPGKTGEVGALSLSVGGDPGLGFSVRTACADATSEIACSPPGAAAGRTLVVNGGAPLDVIVDGEAQSASFTLDALYQVAVCGDGVVVPPEACDDGALVDGDGCSATCTFEPAFYCAAAAPLAPGYTKVDAASAAPSGFTGTCTGEGAAERVFVFTPDEGGTLDVGVQSDAALGLYARADCADAASELGCAKPTGNVTTLHLAVSQGVPVYVFVDGGTAWQNMPAFLLTTVFFPSGQ